VAFAIVVLPVAEKKLVIASPAAEMQQRLTQPIVERHELPPPSGGHLWRLLIGQFVAMRFAAKTLPDPSQQLRS